MLLRDKPDGLDRVLIRTYRAIAAQAPQITADFTGMRQLYIAVFQRGMGHIVHNADGEDALGRGLLKLLIHGEDAAGRGVLAAQSVAAADDGDVVLPGVGQGGDHVHIQGLALRAGLLGAVQHGDLGGGGGDGGQELVGPEGAVQADLDHAHLLAAAQQFVHGFFRHGRAGPHDDQHPFGFGVTVVVEEPVPAARERVDPVHVLLDDARQGVDKGVARFPELEILREEPMEKQDH